MPVSTSPRRPSKATWKPPFSTLIFDVGDVLVAWSADTKPSISSKVLHRILVSPAWGEFECGRITQDECYRTVSAQYGIDANELSSALDIARTSLRFNAELFNFIRDLKARYGLAVYAMTNMSEPDFRYIRDMKAPWEIFDEIFTSYEAGERKPDFPFYQKVLTSIGTDPQRTIFVDDKLDNVISARSFGIHGIVFQNASQAMQDVMNLVCDPVERARKYLRAHAGNLESESNTGITLYEDFAQFLILEATGDRSLIKYSDSKTLFNFFRGKSQLTTDTYPPDTDTNAIAWTTIKDKNDPGAQFVLDEILRFRNPDNVVSVYFDNERPRIDPVVCLNALSLFYFHGRGHELAATVDFVGNILENRAYEEGTRYYRSGDAFLFFFARLLSHADDKTLNDRFSDVLAERLSERIGSPGDSLELAMRVSACSSLQIHNEIDLKRLLSRQRLDGSWDDGWFYRYGMTGILLGNRGLTTAYAAQAIELAAMLRQSPSTNRVAAS